MNNSLRTVLFDLDGTLADTAPDLTYALNTLREQEGRPALPPAAIRPMISHGTKGLLQLGFDITPDDAAFGGLRQRLLALYRAHLTRETRLFPGMAEVLERIEQSGMNWGVVTNKPAFLTEPLIEQLGLTSRAACVVSGDTTPHSKPHPAPILHACALAGSHAAQCLYIGDAQCDIEAGRRAGMKTLVAAFGYLAAEDQPAAWNADGIVERPAAILQWIAGYENAARRCAADV
ncbi:MAG: HAD-IA family hydrolase [Pseudomonadota bacterium]